MLYPRGSRANKEGFSLIEILIASSILLIVISALLMALTQGEFFNAITAAKVDLQAQVRGLAEWIAKDVRQATLIEINSPAPWDITKIPSGNYIKFRKVMGINDADASYALSTNYTEYNYDNVSLELTRREVDDGGAVLSSLVFRNITQSPFFSDVEVVLAPGGILASRKLVVVITAQGQARVGGGAVDFDYSLTEEIKVRNE